VYAFERSQFRFKTLEKMLAKANCKNVKTTCGDFTQTDPASDEYRNVTRM
jgi:putative methyltransferase